jgi:hypothetical protein
MYFHLPFNILSRDTTMKSLLELQEYPLIAVLRIPSPLERKPKQ